MRTCDGAAPIYPSMYGEEIYRTRTILPTACTSELILAMTLGFGQTKPTDNSAHHELLELILNSSFSALFEDEVLGLRLRFFFLTSVFCDLKTRSLAQALIIGTGRWKLFCEYLKVIRKHQLVPIHDICHRERITDQIIALRYNFLNRRDACFCSYLTIFYNEIDHLAGGRYAIVIDNFA